jgi:hypothetical protein
MMRPGSMMVTRPVPASEVSILKALAVLLDPDAGPKIETLAGSLSRTDVGEALLGLRQLLDMISALTPVQPVIEQALEDLRAREAQLDARESALRKREQRADRVDKALSNFSADL